MRLWLDNNQALAEFFRQLPPSAPIALDTEFDWTRTYYPIFALLQIGVNREEAAIVDALAITDWTPLSEALASPQRRKIFFGASNDLPILVRACGGVEKCLPVNIFDVQMAEGFCGKGSSMALKKVIFEELGIELDKSETRSDWTQRPLTPKQLEYAADDVVLLPELAVMLEERMAQKKTLKAFNESMNSAFDADFYAPVDENKAWRRVSGNNTVKDERARRRLRALATWRECTARDANFARTRILSDLQLCWVAQTNPKDVAALRSMPRVKNHTLRDFGTAIIQAQNMPVPPLPAGDHVQQRFTPALKATFNNLVERVLSLVQKRAAEFGVESTLLASRREVENVVARKVRGLDFSNAKILQGWRYDLLAPAIDDILK